MIKRVFVIGTIVIVVAAVLFFAIDGSAKKEVAYKTVEVEKGSIVDKALAVGKIEPKLEVAVKSKISGIVKRTFVEIGDYVNVGDPLFDIGPDPTPIELTEAQRDVEIRQVTYDNDRREADRLQSLMDKNLISSQEYDNQKANCEASRLRLQLAMTLLESRINNARLKEKQSANGTNAAGLPQDVVDSLDPLHINPEHPQKSNKIPLDIGRKWLGLPFDIHSRIY